MAKIVLPTISGGYASVTQLNTAFDQLETELQSKVLYRDNPTGEPNQLENDLDMNGHRLLNQLATNGNENFAWMGVWTTGTAYSVNNLVYAPEGSNEGATLICITAHTAGATLDGDSAKWAVLAARGAFGAGTGDVVGPASSTADSLARYNGVTGKLLKDGAVIGTDVQAQSAKLQSYHDNTLTAANKIPYATALNTASELDFLDEDTMVSDSATAIPSQQSVKAYVDTEIAALSGATAGTYQVAAGTNLDFTGIPAGTKRIIIGFNSISTTGTNTLLIQLGDSGGLENTGYFSTSAKIADSAATLVTSAPDGFRLYQNAETFIFSGHMILTLISSSLNLWVSSHTGKLNTAQVVMGGGSKALSAELTQLRITTTGGTDSFDGGSINILYD